MGKTEAILELKSRIAKAPEGTVFCRQALIYLIDQSEQLTKAVGYRTTMPRLGKEICFGRHDIHSSSNTTKLGSFYKDHSLEAYIEGREDGESAGKIIWVVNVTPSGKLYCDFTQLPLDRKTRKAIRSIPLDNAVKEYRDYITRRKYGEEIDFAMFIGNYPGGPNYTGEYMIPRTR